MSEAVRQAREALAAAKVADAVPRASATTGAAEILEVKKRGRPAGRDLIVKVAIAAGTELGVYRDTAYMRLRRGDHIECFPVVSHAATRALRVLAHANGIVASRNAVEEACDLLEARAFAEGRLVKVYKRAACDGRDACGLLLNSIILDPGRDDRSLYLIEPGRWTLIASDDPRAPWMERGAGFAPLPDPAEVGDLESLWRIINVDQADRLLFLAAIIHVWRAAYPQPVIGIRAEHGTGKTSVARIFRRFADPNVAPVCGLPRTPDEVLVVSSANAVTVFDNVSALAADVSDALCMIATKTARLTRKLYSDGEISMVHAGGTVVLTSISDAVLRGDLADRLVGISLPPIDSLSRKSEADLDLEIEKAAPRIFRALLDVTAATLGLLPSVKLEKRERGRLADFSDTGESLARALGYPPGTFDRRISMKADENTEIVLEASPFALTLLKYVRERGSIHTPPRVLLDELAKIAGDHETRSLAWPKTPATFSSALRRLAPSLRRVGGLTIVFGHDHQGRFIDIQQEAVGVAAVTGDYLGPDNQISKPGCSSCLFFGSCGEAAEGTTICSNWEARS